MIEYDLSKMLGAAASGKPDLLKGKPVFSYNLLAVEHFRWEGPEALTPGKHTILFDFKYNGPGFGKGGTGVLSVDGKEVARKTIPHTTPFLMTIDESFDVGVDTRTGVDDKRLSAAVPLHRQAGQTDNQPQTRDNERPGAKAIQRCGPPGRSVSPMTKDPVGRRRMTLPRLAVGESHFVTVDNFRFVG